VSSPVNFTVFRAEKHFEAKISSFFIPKEKFWLLKFSSDYFRKKVIYQKSTQFWLAWHSPFQYGPVIKLPLNICQCHMVNHMELTNAQRLQF
jgi:hypothetical protein